MVTYVDEKHFLFSTWDKPLEAIYSDTTYTVVQTENVFGIYKVSSSEKELIPWDVLDWQDNTFTLISRYVLDQYRWNYSVSLTAAGNNNVTYVKSSVRTWLVKTFLNDIFSTDEQAYLLASTVDNSLTTTGDSSNPSLSPSTLDKIWLPSYQEMTLGSYGFSTDASRMCFGGYETDSFGSTCSYLLRTRSGTDGKIKAVGAKGEITTVAGNSNCGIRPMIRLSVK